MKVTCWSHFSGDKKHKNTTVESLYTTKTHYTCILHVYTSIKPKKRSEVFFSFCVSGSPGLSFWHSFKTPRPS